MKNKEIILGMDHNINFLKHDVHPKTQEFLELNLDMNLLPVITKPTRVSTTSATLIDNIFVSNRLQHSINSAVIITDISDHFPCILTVNNFNQSKDRKTKITKRKLNKENMDKIKNDIGNIDWETEIKNQDINKAFEIFHNKLQEILNLHAPERTLYLKEKRTNKPWISKNLANSIRKSKILYKKSLDNPAKLPHYKDYPSVLKQTKRIAKIKYYQSMCNDFRNNTKKLWDMINNLIKKNANKTTILNKLVLNNKEYTSGKDISEILAKHFSPVGKTYANNIKPSTKGLNYYCNKIPLNNTSLYFKPTDMVEISNIINKLANKSSYGYDQISNKLIKELCPVILHPLMLIFNKSLEEGMFPDLMKQADTIPLSSDSKSEGDSGLGSNPSFQPHQDTDTEPRRGTTPQPSPDPTKEPVDDDPLSDRGEGNWDQEMPDTNKQQGVNDPADPEPAPGEVPEGVQLGDDQVGASDGEEPREPEEPLEPYEVILQGFRTITQTLSAAYGAASAEIDYCPEKPGKNHH